MGAGRRYVPRVGDVVMITGHRSAAYEDHHYLAQWPVGSIFQVESYHVTLRRYTDWPCRVRVCTPDEEAAWRLTQHA